MPASREVVIPHADYHYRVSGSRRRRNVIIINANDVFFFFLIMAMAIRLENGFGTKMANKNYPKGLVRLENVSFQLSISKAGH